MIFTAQLTNHVKEPVLLGLEDVPAAVGTSTFVVHNPSTGALLATLPDMGIEETRAAIDAATTAQIAWAARPARERSAILRRWHDLILAHIDDLAAVLTAEMGKPLPESKSELQHAAAYIEWYAEEAKRVYGETIPAPSSDRRMLAIKQPVGVVGTITPWNFPASMVARKISPMTEHGGNHCQHAKSSAADEKDEQQQNQRRVDFIIEEKPECDFLRIFKGKAEENNEENRREDSKYVFHGASLY